MRCVGSKHYKWRNPKSVALTLRPNDLSQPPYFALSMYRMGKSTMQNAVLWRIECVTLLEETVVAKHGQSYVEK